MTGYEFMGWTASCDVASDGSDFTALTDFGTADSDKDFYAVFAVATINGGGGTATTGSVTMKYSNTSTTTNMTEGNNAATVGLDANEWSVVPTQGSASNMPGLNKAEDIRLYGHANGGNYLTITSKSYTVTSAEITYTSNSYNNGKFYVNGTETAADNINSKEFVIKNANSGTTQVRIKTLVINYTSGSAGTTTYSDYITTCASGIEYVELGDDFKWSATEAEVTIDATDNEFPTLTNTHNVPVKYSSSDDAIATIAADGTVTLKKEGSVTITAKYEGGTSAGTGKEYKAKTVTYSLTVNKAVAQPTGTMYVKVTDAITDGEYLIVYETGKVAFNGALDALDVASNTVEVTISDNVITGNTDIDKALFTIDATNGTVLSASGKYIGGKSSNENGINISETALENDLSIDQDDNAVIASNGKAIRYNKTAGQTRFRYFKDNGGTQEKIQLYKKVDPNAVVEPIFTPAAGEYYGTQSVTISCATAGAEVYYTLDGNDPTSASTKYTGAISIASTTTIKAVAIKGENSSAVVSATYTILAPLATMQAIFDKATAVGETATPIHITMNNWVVTGVKNNNVYVTDGTKGLIIYTASHGFNVGDILSGTVACKVQLYNGSSELTELTSTTEGLTVRTGGVVTPVVVNDVATLGGVNTGSVIKITGPCTVDGTKYYVAGVQLYNSLYTYTNPEDGYNYECTGVYLQYNTTKEILPRKAEDLVKIETQQPAGISFAVTEHTAEVGADEFAEPTLTNPNSLTVTYKTSDETLATVDATTGEVTIGNKEGKVTITASFAGSDDYVAANASYNITITDPSISEATFVAATDLGNTTRGEGSIAKSPITFACSDGILGNGSEYRLYQDANITFAAENGYVITKVVITSTASGTSEYGPAKLSTEEGTYTYSGKEGTWVGEAYTVTLTATAQTRATLITVYYKQDNRAEADLAWNPATVSLTVGDAFTVPTFSNPNSLTVNFKSSNADLATVNNSGVISLVSGKTGTATITATFAGNKDYKAAEVTCTITVDHKSEDVVILAKCKDQYYAMVAEYVEGKTDVLQALPVEYVNGKIYNVETEDQASIIWKRVVVNGKTTFKNGDNYLSAVNSAALKLATETCDWVFEGDMYKIEGSTRTILYYTSTGGFKNYATTNMSKDGVNGEYSSAAITVAPAFADGNAYHRTTTPNKFGTICLPFGSTNYTGATFYEFVGSETGKVYLGSVTTLVAGTPYIFLASATEVAVYGDGTTAATPGSNNGLVGTFTNDTEVAIGNYILKDNAICEVAATCWVNAYRAYIVMEDVPTGAPTQMPGRRYIGMSVQGENEATGFDNIQLPNANSQKLIINGQLIIIRDGEMYNAQGQRL